MRQRDAEHALRGCFPFVRRTTPRPAGTFTRALLLCLLRIVYPKPEEIASGDICKRQIAEHHKQQAVQRPVSPLPERHIHGIQPNDDPPCPHCLGECFPEAGKGILWKK